MSAFGLVAARSCASHEGLALALAEELGCDTSGAPEAIRRLAAELPRDPQPAEALEAIADPATPAPRAYRARTTVARVPAALPCGARSWMLRTMSIGGSLFLIAVGAILYFAVTAQFVGIEIQTVGLILMIIGLLGLVLALYFMSRARRT